MIDILLKILINSFIFLMLFWMVFWDKEKNNPIRKYWIPKVKSIFIYLGLTAQWKMFSPNPPSRNIWPNAKIHLNNGEFVLWEPTKIQDMNILDKLKYKKFHKFYFEVARPKKSYNVKRDFVEFLLNKYSFQEEYKKVEVFMICQYILPYRKRNDEKLKVFKQLVFTFENPKNIKL